MPTSHSRRCAHASGYRVTFHGLNRCYNLLLSVLFMILAIPVLVFLIPAIILTNGLPVCFAGNRMGLNKKIFTMYKFRTLPQNEGPDAGQDHCSPGHPNSWFCGFLRDTRLDEIPQLWNILKGEMDFIGPRPVRPAVYASQCRLIRGYDKRFQVKPGLIGYSQLFTPHSTPARIRSRIDNRALRNRKIPGFDTLLIGITVTAVFCKAMVLMGRRTRSLVMDNLLNRYTNRRCLDRVRQPDVRVYFDFPKCAGSAACLPEADGVAGILRDINEGYARVDTDRPLAADTFLFRAEIRVDAMSGRVRKKTFSAHGKVFRVHENKAPLYRFIYILRYEPVSQLNQYFVDQYFLRKSLVRYLF